MRTKEATSRSRSGNPFRGIRNIGPAMRRDLALLGVASVAQLATCDADDLYLTLEHKTGRRQDPCVWDTFAAAIHQARTGEARDWWTFTPERKARQAAGVFPGALPRGGRRPPEASSMSKRRMTRSYK